ncbi:flagellar basal-body rod protein FlgG [Planctomyces sp. SH-PL14]|uniref:flagellar basal-body rod protein FlgG n=1 Tax=Planctomyces sp. SH-PL14 TaxID=1632864 RepID=UPI00078EE5A8|nr:flagellar basal-body rod protein FlgG [Planctomyces sp. SH-PL14]AMV21577.1 Flagellar basal-body rod protein FlgG [Planctomyces sp. SH-PL14]
MLRALYTSATGMRAQETLIDNTANNIANVNTTGFKRSQLNFADLLYTTSRAAGTEVATGQVSPTGLQIGSGVRAVGTTKSFLAGVAEQTGNPLDVMIVGDGFIKVELPGGEFRYTRDGSLKRDQTGQLVTGDGYRVFGGLTIQDGTTNITIGTDGTISGIGPTGDPVSIGNLQLARFLNPAGLSSEGGNLYRVTPASGPENLGTPGLNGLGTILQNHLEKSNVQVVTELISLITAQRAYEVNSRAVRAGDEMLSTTNDIVR